MKLSFLLITVLFASTAFSMKMKGMITYVLPNGELVDTMAVLEIPEEQDEAVVTLNSEDLTWESTNYGYMDVRGENLFWVVFKTTIKDTKKTIALKGNLLSGPNRSIYRGSILEAQGHMNIENFEQLTKLNYAKSFSFENKNTDEQCRVCEEDLKLYSECEDEDCDDSDNDDSDSDDSDSDDSDSDDSDSDDTDSDDTDNK